MSPLYFIALIYLLAMIDDVIELKQLENKGG